MITLPNPAYDPDLSPLRFTLLLGQDAIHVRPILDLRLRVKLLSPRKGYEISVRREGDGLHLPGSPYVLKPAVRMVRGT